MFSTGDALVYQAGLSESIDLKFYLFLDYWHQHHHVLCSE